MIKAKVTKVNREMGYILLKDECGNTHICEKTEVVFTAKRGQAAKIISSQFWHGVLHAVVELR